MCWISADIQNAQDKVARLRRKNLSCFVQSTLQHTTADCQSFTDWHRPHQNLCNQFNWTRPRAGLRWIFGRVQFSWVHFSCLASRLRRSARRGQREEGSKCGEWFYYLKYEIQAMKKKMIPLRHDFAWYFRWEIDATPCLRFGDLWNKKTNLKSLIATHISLEPASKEDLDRGWWGGAGLSRWHIGVFSSTFFFELCLFVCWVSCPELHRILA